MECGPLDSLLDAIVLACHFEPTLEVGTFSLGASGLGGKQIRYRRFPGRCRLGACRVRCWSRATARSSLEVGNPTQGDDALSCENGVLRQKRREKCRNDAPRLENQGRLVCMKARDVLNGRNDGMPPLDPVQDTRTPGPQVLTGAPTAGSSTHTQGLLPSHHQHQHV